MNSVSDSKNNAYNAAAGGNVSNANVQIYFSVLTAALAVNDTITVLFSSNISAVGVSVIDVKGLPNAVLDATGASAGSSTNPSFSTSSSTISPSEAAIAVIAVNGPSGDIFTAGTGWTVGARAGTTGGSATSNVTCDPETQALSSMGSITATATLGTLRGWAGAIATFMTTPPATVHGTRYAPQRASSW